jgi:hypothetical protein
VQGQDHQLGRHLHRSPVGPQGLHRVHTAHTLAPPHTHTHYRTRTW